MPGKTSAEREALARQNAGILALFTAAGFEHIQPDILQPADVFLDRSGEDIRTRTFVFTDPEGRELCLRPDLTVPTCRYHLEHAAAPEVEARYCYAGPAFRHHPGGVAVEFDQAGIEHFGAGEPAVAEVDILKLAVKAVRGAGLDDFTVRIGDLGLIHALLDAIAMPERWRRRLRHQFWRPREFRALVQTLTGDQQRPRTSLSPLLDELAGTGGIDAGTVGRLLEDRGLPLVGGRSLEDIAGRLEEKLADRAEPPLPGAAAAHIDGYLAIRGTPDQVSPALSALAKQVGGRFAGAVDRFLQRRDLLAALASRIPALEFAGVFGRSLEYYTGFVFQIEAPGADGLPLIIAGGGRYDRMLSDIGSPVEVPAVGCAIHTERLLAQTARQGGTR